MSVPAMFPLMVDVTALPVVFIGGASLAGRLAALDEHGAKDVHVFAPDPTAELVARAHGRLNPRLPDPADFARIRPGLVFIADMDDAPAAMFRAQAKAVGALVHVHDRIPLCDFHLPAKVRRGHLQVTVSTDGTAAGLSRLIRQYLETEVFGPEWGVRLEELAAARLAWKAQGLGGAELAARIEAMVVDRGWLPLKNL